MTKDIDIADLKRIAGVVQSVHGYDFHNYATSSFKRRVLRVLDLKKMSVDTLLQRIETQPQFMDELLGELTVNVTEMFRDPGFWIIVRDKIIPSIISKDRPLKIWHAGCSSGEEVFSMAILLHEMRITSNFEILATDIDPKVVEKAKEGTFPIKHLEVNEKNYSKLETGNRLNTWFRQVKGTAILDHRLLKNITFQKHDLVTGNINDTFDLILCRNVMIYFNQALQNDVLTMFHRNLVMNGFLAIGAKETLIWCDVASKFEVFNTTEKIYRKIKN
ncbi:MAG TPA: protein-glutamate O-methyltransferase CheR [Cyclobacteriaceae bacterium]|nr:protein-glutamate O-methyltransferase CheR [Cyclobacteriaceae bacterium]